MRTLDVLIGPDPWHSDRLCRLLGANHKQLAAHGIHVLHLPDDIAPQPELWPVGEGLRHVVVAPGLGQYVGDTSALAQGLGSSARIHCHIDTPARMALWFYRWAVLAGRNASAQDMIDDCAHPAWAPQAARHTHDASPHWLDLKRFVRNWSQAFGPQFIAHWTEPDSPARLWAHNLWAALSLPGAPVLPHEWGAPIPDGTRSERLRLLNPLLEAYCNRHHRVLPPRARAQIASRLGAQNPGWDAGHFNAISHRYMADREAILKECPYLPAAALMAPPDAAIPSPQAGEDFRATQFLTALAPHIDRMARRAVALPAHVYPILDSLHRTGMAPRRQMQPPAPSAPATGLAGPATGTTLIACMKNEAPFILEWIAHHRAIGVDRFLIYTNDCTDGTTDILNRLETMGLVQHRDNTKWRGKSPQQHALNQSLRDPAVQDARWVVHIDVDEFINVRCGDGTLSALFKAVPQATHFAMTWRLFGHDGVHAYQDALVTEQFTHCAPLYCPKPHSAWGFKTLGQNLGAYEKIGCHRPNKLRKGHEARLHWVNGSGHDITAEVAQRGWRSNRGSVGYDLVQLNHYALRSAESFLVKRDRGRALHVDRSIGRNYWIRMDWGGDEDRSIQRHVPRLRAELERLMADPQLAALHRAAVAWHSRRATDLRARPEYAALYEDITTLALADDERAAWSLALSMES